jgi:2-polyprenyl-3-methyl-5-hydroxy-6-metoxy-1,4-benzoquinol methylase
MAHSSARGRERPRLIAPVNGGGESATLSRTALTEAWSARGDARPTACPACGRATRHRFLYAKNDCDILRCEECGLGRAETRGFDPSDYYTGDYFSGKHSDGYADYLGAERTLRREFAHTLRFIRRFRRSGRLLDVGCAYGFFLQEARRDFDVSGIELAQDAAEHCRRSGLNVLTGQVEPDRLRELGAFDVIVLLDVIEHLPSPRETVALLAQHLNPGGILIITTGDFGAVSARLAGARWRLMTPPQHLWFFSEESMRRMMTSLGLEVEHFDHPWKLVPLSLLHFQLARMAGRHLERVPAWGGLGLPVNLFDAMRIVLRKASHE